MENKLIKEYFVNSQKIGVIGAVSQINARYLAKSADDSRVNMKEVKEFAEYLRDNVFSNKENYSAMIENWGCDPYIMRLVGVKTNVPIGIVSDDLIEEEEDFDKDLFDEPLDDDDFDLDTISKNAELLFDKLYLISGDMTLTFASDAGMARLDVWEGMKDLMSETIISFLADFIFVGGGLSVNFLNPETGKNTVFGFQSDGEDWYPLTKKDLKRAYETDAETGKPLPPLPDTVYRELRK